MFRSINLVAAIRDNKQAQEELAAAIRDLQETMREATTPHTVPTFVQTSHGLRMAVPNGEHYHYHAAGALSPDWEV